MEQSKLIAIAGGIGSGKSVVSRILRIMGYRVYDCDSRAKELMGQSEEMKSRIKEEVFSNAVTLSPSGTLQIDRKALAKAVFSDTRKLNRLNEIVHGAVKHDVEQWRETNGACGKPLFVETAILYTSGMDQMVDGVWMVEAPMQIRLLRAMGRDNATKEEIAARINKQHSEEVKAAAWPHTHTSIIINDGIFPLLPQITGLLAELEKPEDRGLLKNLGRKINDMLQRNNCKIK